MDAKAIPPTFPFHISKAYNAAAPARATAVGAPVQPAKSEAGVTVRASGDSVQITGARPARMADAAERLVGARVNAGADFSAPAAAPASSGAASFPMYRHPADKNAAATGVRAGRMVDVEG